MFHVTSYFGHSETGAFFITKKVEKGAIVCQRKRRNIA
nr:MAG TPA: hypothetical protein [Caudoviricetes sp.]